MPQIETPKPESHPLLPSSQSVHAMDIPICSRTGTSATFGFVRMYVGVSLPVTAICCPLPNGIELIHPRRFRIESSGNARGGEGEEEGTDRCYRHALGACEGSMGAANWKVNIVGVLQQIIFFEKEIERTYA